MILAIQEKLVSNTIARISFEFYERDMVGVATATAAATTLFAIMWKAQNLARFFFRYSFRELINYNKNIDCVRLCVCVYLHVPLTM